MSTAIDLAAIEPSETFMKLPFPYFTEYTLQKSFSGGVSAQDNLYQLHEKPETSAKPLPFQLHSIGLRFTAPTDVKSSELPPTSNNGAWARARRSPYSIVSWDDDEIPTIAQMWFLFYIMYTARPGMETVRVELKGRNARIVAQQIKDVLLGVEHPRQRDQPAPTADDKHDVVIGYRSTFWQGAGSPFGPRPVWCPAESPASLPSATPLASFPITPTQQTLTVTSAGDPQDPERHQQSRHPIRPAKPAPGSTVYSRYIPHLKEMYSMVVLDYRNPEHLNYFHTWQNDPRVSQGWNETGTLDEHREYLRKIDEDPHQFAVLGKWDDTCFAYFEMYWAKEDRLGSFYDAHDWDRGRHSLVGDVRFRGPHRVSAWWSSQMHYLFLDDPRTMRIVGEPKDANATVIMYDLIHGFGIDHFVDLPHKRSGLLDCHRERFFQLCPVGDNEKVVGGIKIGLVPKL